MAGGCQRSTPGRCRRSSPTDHVGGARPRAPMRPAKSTDLVVRTVVCDFIINTPCHELSRSWLAATAALRRTPAALRRISATPEYGARLHRGGVVRCVRGVLP